MKKFAALLLVLLAAIPLAACAGSKNSLIPVRSVSFYKSEVELNPGQSQKLDYKIFPANATNQKVQFFSSDPSAVSVTEDGTVTLNRNQSAVVTVRSVDGMYESTCMVTPRVLPTQLSLDTTKTEQKVIDGTARDVLTITVGQSKVLPVVSVPASANKDSFKFSVSPLSSSAGASYPVAGLQFENAAEWIVSATGEGRAMVSVTSDSAGENQLVCQFEVWVQPAPNSVGVYLNGSMVEVVDNSASVQLSVDQSAALIRLELLKGDLAINQVAHKMYLSQSNVIDAFVVNSFDSFKTNVTTDSNRFDLFNNACYVKVTPRSDGSSKLFLVSDAVGSDGNPICITINVLVGESPNDADVSLVSAYKGEANKNVVVVGQNFSLDINPYLGTTDAGGFTVKKPISLEGRAVYFSVGGSEIKLTDSDGVYSLVNNFVAATQSNSAVTITAYIAKTQSVAPLTEGANLSDYLVKTIEVWVQKEVNDLVWGVQTDTGYNWYPDASEIAVKSEDVKNLGCYCFNTFNTFTAVIDTAWSYNITSTNSDVISVMGKTLTAKSTTGSTKLTITLIDGIKTITREIVVHISD